MRVDFLLHRHVKKREVVIAFDKIAYRFMNNQPKHLTCTQTRLCQVSTWGNVGAAELNTESETKTEHKYGSRLSNHVYSRVAGRTSPNQRNRKTISAPLGKLEEVPCTLDIVTFK